MLKGWTIGRAEGIGAVAGFAALILWPVYAAWAQILPFFLLALMIAAFCGLSLLVITLFDLARHPRRGTRLVPIRVFDIVLGLGLTVPSLIELRSLLPDLLAIAA
jgi:hypothetical protein